MMQSMTDGTGTTEFTYHPVGSPGALQIASIDGPLPGTSDLIAHTYDALGRLKTRNIGPNGNENLTTWHFDPLRRIESLIHNLGTFEYDYVATTDRINEMLYPNGQRTEFDYDTATNDHRLKTIHHKTAGNATLSRFDYGYSPDGTITTWDRQFDSDPATRYAFGYDRANQLTSATLVEAATPSNILHRHSYAYDKAGNRQSTQSNHTLTRATHNIANQITELEGGGKLLVAGHTDKPAKITVNGIAAETDADNNYQAWIDVQTGTNTITVEAEDWTPNTNISTQSWTVDVAGTPNRAFTYDINGNTLTDGLRSYEWDAENRLVKITYADSSSTEFTYNGFSQRIRIIEKDPNNAITSDKRYLWAASNQPEEQRAADGTTVLKRYYNDGEQRIGGTDAGMYYYSRDHLGSIREVTGASGTLHARYDYDPYGNQTNLTGDLNFDFAFTGHYLHAKSGLHLTLFRAYDSEIGRWISPDPIEEAGGLNLYGYVEADPINFWDPLGLESVGGSGCIYRSDPFGHGTKADGTPVDPHIDRITKNRVKYRYNQDGTPRDGAPRIPKSDQRAFATEQARLNRTLNNIQAIRPPGGRMGLRMGGPAAIFDSMWNNYKEGKPLIPLIDWISGGKEARKQQFENEMLSKPNSWCPKS